MIRSFGFSLLPNLDAFIFRHKKRIGLSDVESIIPRINEWESPIDTPLTQGMRIHSGETAHFGLGDVLRPHTSVGKEEALFGGEAVFHRQRMVFSSILEGSVSELQASVIA